MFGDRLEAIWRRCLAPYLGEPRAERIVLRVVTDAGPDQRRRWLDEVGGRAAALF